MCLANKQLAISLQRSARHGIKVMYVLFLLLFLPTVVSAHTIAEVVNNPATFAQQTVNITGEVANMVTRYGETPYTTFDLQDANGTTVPVFTWGAPTFKQGDVCRVTGSFVLEKTFGTHELARGVEAEKIEKVSGAGYRTTGQLFRKKRNGERPDGNSLRGFVLPR